MQILDFFERAYIVNLPDRKDRRRATRKELQKAGMALTPGKLEFFPAVRPDLPGEFPTIGARGCFMSHLAILKLARDKALTNVLILEDDVLIRKEFKPDQPILAEQLSQTDWGFAYFGHPIFTVISPTTQFVKFSEPITTTHFYGVHCQIFDRVIEFLDAMQARSGGHPDGGPMHLDGAYNLFRQQNPDIVALKTMPSLANQRCSRSDVHPNSWYEQIPISRQIVDFARTGKSILKIR